jgi:oligopeptide/dipeptide ABC transporter ATP-binding protein
VIPEPLLKVEGLKTYFFVNGAAVKAVDGINLAILPQETLGLVGESGCGKSVTALSILRLIPTPGKIIAGKIYLDGRDLLALPERDMRQVRGNRIAMVFQEPMTSLNPVFTIGNQIMEAVILHQKVRRKEARARMLDALSMVGFSSPEEQSRSYPHQLSGGMRQRVMIAMALSCRPALLIADEPTTALDVTIQAQILKLLIQVKEKLKMSLILITHDLGIIAEVADKVAIMYAGKIVEYAPVNELFERKLHPYTRALFDCLPKLDEEIKRLRVIPGNVPDLAHLPKGCAFQDRCPYAVKKSFEEEPVLEEVLPGHFVACHNWKRGQA